MSKRSIQIGVGMVLLTFWVWGASSNTQPPSDPGKAMDKIFDEIPNEWWKGGWDKRNEIDRVVDAHPDSSTLKARQLLYHADYHYSKKETINARGLYEEILADYPNEPAAPTALYHLADLHRYQLKKNDQALEKYRAVVQRYPRSESAARALYILGQFDWSDTVGRYYQRILDDYASDTRGIFDANVGLARVAIRARNIDSAILHLSAARPYAGRFTYSDYAYVENDIIKSLFREGRKSEGLTWAWTVVTESDDIPRSGWRGNMTISLAEHYQVDGNFKQARNVLSKLENTPEQSGWYLQAVKKLNSPEYSDTYYTERHQLELSRRLQTHRENLQRPSNLLTQCVSESFQQKIATTLTNEQAIQMAAAFYGISDTAAGDLLANILVHDFDKLNAAYERIRVIHQAFSGGDTLADLVGCLTAHTFGHNSFSVEPRHNQRAFESIHQTAIREYWSTYSAVRHEDYVGALGPAQSFLKKFPARHDVRVLYAISLASVQQYDTASTQIKLVPDTYLTHFNSPWRHNSRHEGMCRLGSILDGVVNDTVMFDFFKHGMCSTELVEAHYRRGNYFEALVEFDMRYSDLWQVGQREALDTMITDCRAKVREWNYEFYTIAESADNFPDLDKRLITQRLKYFKERKLPTTATYREPDHRLDMASAALNGVAAKDLAYAARDGHFLITVYSNRNIDRQAYPSKDGYWTQFSFDGGASWAAPLYLGIADLYPYVINNTGHYVKPLNGANIQIRAEHRELAETSITLPQIPKIVTHNIRTDIFLDFSLSALIRDSDKDGLTDLYEDRLGMNPFSKDTDRDGTDDLNDSLPLNPANPKLDELADMFSALVDYWQSVRPLYRDPNTAEIHATPRMTRKRSTHSPELEQIRKQLSELETRLGGHLTELSRSVEYIFSDWSFSGSRHPATRTILMNAASAELFNKKFGLCFGFHIRRFYTNRNRTKAYVRFDEIWTGGNAILVKENGTWKVIANEWWIT